jgi:predicted alpha/beta hydrolase
MSTIANGSTTAAAAAAAGFDVWMPNTRGNTFSTGNFYFSSRQVEYWQHSVDEYALLDSPAMVDKVLEVTGASKMAWVGHSQVHLRRVEGMRVAFGSHARTCGAMLAKKLSECTRTRQCQTAV